MQNLDRMTSLKGTIHCFFRLKLISCVHCIPKVELAWCHSCMQVYLNVFSGDLSSKLFSSKLQSERNCSLQSVKIIKKTNLMLRTNLPTIYCRPSESVEPPLIFCILVTLDQHSRSHSVSLILDLDKLIHFCPTNLSPLLVYQVGFKSSQVMFFEYKRWFSVRISIYAR